LPDERLRRCRPTTPPEPSGAEACATLASASSEHGTTTTRGKACAEAVRTGTLDLARLERSFHVENSGGSTGLREMTGTLKYRSQGLSGQPIRRNRASSHETEKVMREAAKER